MAQCQAYVHPTNSWGKLPKRKCTKESVIKDLHDRDLCRDHYNRWFKKVTKHQHIKQLNLQS